MNDGGFELAPALPLSNNGVLWDLDEAAFLRWWRALPQVDREEFTAQFQGDEILARFVCAIHYMSTVQQQAASPGVIVAAYGIAAGLNPNAPETRIRASKAWRADCVQMLLMRLHQRSAEQAKARILNSVTHVLETGLTEALMSGDIKEKAVMAQAALKFVKLVNDEQAEERRERQKRGWQKIIEDSKKELSGDVEAPNIEQAKLYQRMLQSSLGPEAYNKLLRETAMSDAEIE